MSPHLCSLLLALHAVVVASTQQSKTCNGGGAQEVSVEGWPVLIAVRVPVMANVTMNLSLSHHQEHIYLTLAHKSQKGNVGMLEATLKSHMAISDFKMAALLPDSTWATLRIEAHHKELEVKIHSEIHSTKYSSSASMNTLHQLRVSKVTCFTPTCNSYIDLQCHNGQKNHTKEHTTSPQKDSSDKGVYYWVFYVVMLLMVLVCLLFLVWRNERNKFRTRWLRHSQTVRTMIFSSDQVENPSQANGRHEDVECRTITREGQSNPGYDNTGDTDN